MHPTAWTDADTERALAVWTNYQARHDVSARKGQAVGIDPASGRVWFGESDLDICLQQQTAGDAAPLYFLRVGFDYYGRKGSRR